MSNKSPVSVKMDTATIIANSSSSSASTRQNPSDITPESLPRADQNRPQLSHNFLLRAPPIPDFPPPVLKNALSKFELIATHHGLEYPAEFDAASWSHSGWDNHAQHASQFRILAASMSKGFLLAEEELEAEKKVYKDLKLQEENFNEKYKVVLNPWGTPWGSSLADWSNPVSTFLMDFLSGEVEPFSPDTESSLRKTTAKVKLWLPESQSTDQWFSKIANAEDEYEVKNLRALCDAENDAFIQDFCMLKSRTFDESMKDADLTEEQFECLNTWTLLLKEMVAERSELLQSISYSYAKIGRLRKYLGSFKAMETILTRKAEFAFSLAVLGRPFKFFKLPREIRDMVYSKLLRFNYNLSIEQLELESKQGRDFKKINNLQARVFVHPLFHTSRELRKEAADMFYKYNTFGIQRHNSIYQDIAWKCLSPAFKGLLRNLSLTWTSLGTASTSTVKVIRSLSRLRSLEIFLHWDKLTLREENNMGGLMAFKNLVRRDPDSKRPALLVVKVYDVQLTFQEERVLESVDWSDYEWGYSITPDWIKDVEKQYSEGLSK